MRALNFNLLFFGSDKFSVNVLDSVLSRKICPVQVVTGAGSLLDKFCANKQLTRYRWPLSWDDTPEKRPNIGLVASFGHLIDADTVNKFQYGLFNVHPSLLPQYRGSTPIQAAIRDGLDETGCTIMKIAPVPKFDVGEIMLQEKLAIQQREWAETLRDRLAILGGEMASKLLLDYQEVQSNARPQSLEGRTYAKKLKPDDGLIRFRMESSGIIDKKVRAYTGTVELYSYSLGGLRISLSGMRDPSEVEVYQLDRLSLALQKKNLRKEVISVEPGTIYFHKLRRTLCIKCADNHWLAFDEVKLENKPKLTALDFYNGYISKCNPKTLFTDV